VHILYRVRQFWHTISLKIDPDELDQANALLNAEQGELFTRLQPAEKQHALVMFEKLLAQGENQSDLLVAALLHDVGKLRYRMNPFERTMVVLAQALTPDQAKRWGVLPLHGWDDLPNWRKVFIVAEQHPVWGAEMACQAGVSPLTESLIRQHHCPPNQSIGAVEYNLQHKLWVVDNES
jgi:hypothetical protein